MSEFLGAMQRCIPRLTAALHKGQCGRVAVIGGSDDYCGAPYFSAISSLKSGADYVRVVCPASTSQVIKSYSPDLVVHPLLNGTQFEAILRWISKSSSIVVGPGLGRDESQLKSVSLLLQQIYDAMPEVPVVIDADGLLVVDRWPDLVKSHPNTILTPNLAEYDRMVRSVLKTEPKHEDPVQMRDLSQKLGGLTIYRKQEFDQISDGINFVSVRREGILRRCAGQGDVLSGVIATFAGWTIAHKNELKQNPMIVASYAAGSLVRESAVAAFMEHSRAMTTQDIVDKLGPCFQQMFDS